MSCATASGGVSVAGPLGLRKTHAPTARIPSTITAAAILRARPFPPLRSGWRGAGAGEGCRARAAGVGGASGAAGGTGGGEIWVGGTGVVPPCSRVGVEEIVPRAVGGLEIVGAFGAVTVAVGTSVVRSVGIWPGWVRARRSSAISRPVL